MARLENSEIAALFGEMADLLQIDGGDRHRIAAFRRAARIIEGLPRPAEELLNRGELDSVRGIGSGTVHRVKQMLRRHSCDDLDQLRRKIGPGLREMLKIKGLGPTTVRNIHNRLGVETIDQLEYAAQAGGIESMPRMGTAMVHKILAGVEAYRKRRGKVPLIEAQRVGRRILASLSSLPEVARIELAGSVRRGKAAIGDLDVLVASSDPGPVSSRFQSLPDVEEVLLRGDSRCSVRLRNQQQADLRVLPPQNFGAGLHYFTGSKLHNIELRLRAGRLGLKVSDKGVFTRDEQLIDPCPEEADVFRHLGLPWIPPELRENQGEVEAADRKRLPKLIEAGDLLGDLHMHTTDSDGAGTLREMSERARELGHRYIAITDHSKALRIANGLDEPRLAAQLQRIRRLDAQLDDLQLRSGIEVDILANGELDLDPALLAQLDWVVASVHRWTDQDEATMTKRVIRAIESGVVDCIGHPTGRRPGKRDAYPLNLEAVLAAARQHQVALECNGGPNRMDLGDVDCRKCRERGVAVVLNTDAHAPRHLGRPEFALAMARRGWLEREHVLNAQPWEVIAERRARRLRDHGDSSWRAVPVQVQVPGGAAPDSEGADEDADPDPDPDPDELRAEPSGSEDHAWIDLDPLEIPIETAHTPVDHTPAEPVAAADPVEDVGALRAALTQGPLSEQLRERLSAWLMSAAADPTLERALGEIGENPLQVGFDLLSKPL
ncbi:DNA polymerase X family protein [Enhygromyxa salina]|uniref:DNA polymerase X family protein n=1 Tax=Enhygromyxa salina TaxID=215803 RepID=A0A0C2D443_9BACT|nr:DNA polymerase/3'-5' exonuclease PolX [Enhygromyxa salina]KIG17976.1 DNA polymerase X family protein [Enhygromyxa salina]